MKKSDWLNTLLFLFFVAGQGCKKDNTETPMPQQTGSVEKLISEKYPDYSEINVRPLDEDRVFEASFKSKQHTYSVIANNERILEAARVSGGEIPEALKEKVNSLNIRGGSFFDYSYNITTGSDGVDRGYHLAGYRLKGVDYTLQAEENFRFINMALRYESKYTTTSLGDLPEKIQAFVRMRAKPNPVVIQATRLNDFLKDYMGGKAELAFTKALVYVMPNGAKLYDVNAYYFGIPLFEFWFNEAGELVLTGSCDKLQKFEKTIEPMDNPQLRDTNLSAADRMFFANTFNSQILGDLLLDTSSETWQAEYNHVKSYQIIYRDASEQNTTRWTFGLDIKKNVLYSFYDYHLNQ